ncbi:MAG TPA: TIGR03915 family putative DNA repair protein [Lachnospiraceae bacterium]|nr:TIGR03915 family putative DNA repair protein [Lachnospiraceae bacterium]
MNRYIFQCEDSIDGIFTAVYDAWDSRYGHDNVYIEIPNENSNYQLFSSYIQVATNSEKAEKVANTIRNKISLEAFENVCRAALSCNVRKADAIYRFIIIGLRLGSSVIGNLSNEAVSAIFEMNRNVSNEVHHYLGFLRFTELRQKILYAKVNPKNNAITLMAPHFAERLPCENWIIHDEVRQLAIIHQTGEGWVQVGTSAIDFKQLGYVEDEEEMMIQLWKAFVDSIAIEDRRNLRLQQQNLPLRFRGNMTEFQ